MENILKNEAKHQPKHYEIRIIKITKPIEKTQGKSIKIKKIQVRILLRKLKTYIRFSIIVCIIFSLFSGRNFNMFSMIFGIKNQ